MLLNFENKEILWKVNLDQSIAIHSGYFDYRGLILFWNFYSTSWNLLASLRP